MLFCIILYQNHIYGFAMLRPRINGLCNQFWSEGKTACQGGAGTLNIRYKCKTLSIICSWVANLLEACVRGIIETSRDQLKSSTFLVLWCSSCLVGTALGISCHMQMVKADNRFHRKLAYLLHYDHIKSTSPIHCWYVVGHCSKPYLEFLYAECFEWPTAKGRPIAWNLQTAFKIFVTAHIIPTDVKKSHTTQQPVSRP